MNGKSGSTGSKKQDDGEKPGDPLRLSFNDGRNSANENPDGNFEPDPQREGAHQFEPSGKTKASNNQN